MVVSELWGLGGAQSEETVFEESPVNQLLLNFFTFLFCFLFFFAWGSHAPMLWAFIWLSTQGLLLVGLKGP